MSQPEKIKYTISSQPKIDASGQIQNVAVYGKAKQPLLESEILQVHGEINFLIDNAFSILTHDQLSAFIHALLSSSHSRYNKTRTEFIQSELKIFSNPLIGPFFSKEHIRKKIIPEKIEKTVFGIVEIIYEVEALGLYRLIIEPGKSIPCHFHNIMLESELILSPGLWLQGKPVKAGSARQWPKGYPHMYENKSVDPKAILCLDSPSFIASDEILSQTPKNGLSDLEQPMTIQYW